MPDPFVFQEQIDPWLGIYQNPALYPRLPRMYSKVLHNVVLENGMPRVRPGLRKLNGALAGDGTRTVYGLAIWRGNPDLLVIACGSKLQTMPLPSGGDLTDIATAFPLGFPTRTGDKTNFAQLGDRLFIVNGVDENVKFNGTNLTRMGLVAPSSLSAPSKSAGSLTGTYQYRATLVSATTYGSVESEPTAALSVNYNTEQGTFTAPTVPSADPQVDRWNLYRNANGGGTFFRVNTAPVTLATNIIDNVADTTLVAGTVMSTLGVNAPPPGKFTQLISHQGRLVGTIATDKNSLYWSDQGIDVGGIFFKPESWPAVNRLPFGELGGTQITALVSFFEWLIVFQNFGVWGIRGVLASETDRLITPLLVAPDNRGVGVSDIGNVAMAENKVYFTAKDGLYFIERETGTSTPDLAIRRVSNQIDYLYHQIDFSAGGTSVYDRDHRRYVFFGKGAA